MVQHSQEQRQERQQGHARSKSRGRRRHRRGKSRQSRAPVAEHTTAQKQSFIPTGHEDTRREELRQEAKEALQREARQEKERARQDKLQQRQQAERTASLEEKMRDEVFNNQKDYVDRAYRRLKAMKLPAADPRVRCLWIFGGRRFNTRSLHFSHLSTGLASISRLGGEYPVPRLPGWLTTFISATSMSHFP